MRKTVSILTIMTVIIVVINFSLVGQTLLNEKIVPSVAEGTIKSVLKVIERQSSIKFVYDDEQIDVSKEIQLIDKEYTIKSLFDELFKDQKLEYLINDQNIIIRKKKGKEAHLKGKATIYGYITDGDNSESLIGASVIELNSGLGVISNYYGYYSLTLPLGEVNLQVSFVGSEKQTLSLLLKKDTLLSVKMKSEDLALDEVVISASKVNAIQATTEMGTINLSRQELKSRPAIGGEVDVIKALQLLPGVQAGVEGSAGLYVRGGGSDQNLILLDGVPVYSTSHLFGFSSVFNADAINNVKMIKGAFPAHYGGRLSSVVDMSMREGSLEEFHGALNVSFIASSVMLEGAIVKGKTSFMIGARRSFLELLSKPFSDDNYYFYDLNLKINHRFSPKDRVFFSTYYGKDAGELNDEESWVVGSGEDALHSKTVTNSTVDWWSAISVVRWNHVISPKVFSNLSLSHSIYNFNGDNKYYSETVSRFSTISSFQQFASTSDISDVSAKLDFDFFPHPSHDIKFGLQYVYHRFKPNVVGLVASERPDVSFNGSNINTQEYNIYLEDEFKISSKFKTNIGIHAAYLSVLNKKYPSLQPRLSVRYLVNNNFSLKASYSEMAQFMHLLTNPGLGLPTDMWVPVTDEVPPQESKQVSLGVVKSLPSLGLELTIEGYHKRMSNLIEYKDGANFLRLNEDWQDKVNIGQGESYGMEFFLNGNWNKFEGWVGYTLSWSNREFEEINFGQEFPFKYDRRHDVKLACTYKFKENVHFSANWVYGTGIAITIPTQQYLGIGGAIGDEHLVEDTPLLAYDSRNGYRMRDSHRLDISASLIKKKKRGERTWVFTVYNAYNRNNPMFIEARPFRDFNGLDWKLRFKEYSFLSIIPSLTYRFAF